MNKLKTASAVDAIKSARKALPKNCHTVAVNYGSKCGATVFLLYGGKNCKVDLAEALMSDLDKLTPNETTAPWTKDECEAYFEGDLNKDSLIHRWAEHLNVGILSLGYSSEHTINP